MGRDSFLFADVSVDGNQHGMVLTHSRLISICGVTHFYVGRDSFLFAGVSVDGNQHGMVLSHSRLISICDVTHSYVRRDSSIIPICRCLY